MKPHVFSLALTLLFIPVSHALELHTPHCLYGCPDGAPLSNDIIVRDNYTLSSNDFTKFADWVAYKVTADTIGSGCTRNWKADPLLNDDETLEPDDYKDAHATLSTDRGHQVPLASFCGTDSWRETNYLSNITAQKSDLNQGPWKHLEEKVREIAETGNDVYVLTGPLYEHVMPSMPESDEMLVVPSGYWKVVAIETADGIETASFAFDQSTPRNTNYCDRQLSVANIEGLTNLNLIPDKSEAAQFSQMEMMCE